MHKGGRQRRTFRRQSADQLKRGCFGLLRARCDGLKMPPKSGSNGLVATSSKCLEKRVELMGEDGRRESLLAAEVIVKRALGDVDVRCDVANAYARVAESLK